MLAREGYALIATAGGLAVVLISVGFLLGGWWWTLAVLGIVLLGFVVWSFRDPLRTAPGEAHDLLLAPADGKVVELTTENEPLYLKGPSQRVSISLSPLNVQVNRSPVSGTVEYERYVPGDRSEVGVRHASGTRVLFKQVAGAAARRIVYDAPVGKTLVAGERYGVARFGSRMDVTVPPHVELDVRLGQLTVAGETVIGRIPGPPPETPDPDFARVAAGRAGEVA